MNQKELDALRKEIDYAKHEVEIKIYEFDNGWVLLENQENMGYNKIIPLNNKELDPCHNRDSLIDELGQEVVNSIKYVSENIERGRLFGWRINVSVEPIYTDDSLLLTKLEQQL